MSRYVTTMDELIDSDDEIEAMFIDACHMLNLDVHTHRELAKNNIATQLMDGPTAYATLELLREYGFNVVLTQGTFYPDKYAVFLQ